MRVQLPALKFGHAGSAALEEDRVSVAIGLCVARKEELVMQEGLVGGVLEVQVGAHDGVPCEGVGVAEVVEDAEGIVEGNESSGVGREVDESACGVGVGDEACEDRLREKLFEVSRTFARLQQ